MRIVKSYKSSAFHDLMEKVREKIKADKSKRENRRRSAVLRSVPKTREERNEQILIDLVGKIENLHDMVSKQQNTIQELRDELNDKIEELSCYKDKRGFVEYSDGVPKMEIQVKSFNEKEESPKVLTKKKSN